MTATRAPATGGPSGPAARGRRQTAESRRRLTITRVAVLIGAAAVLPAAFQLGGGAYLGYAFVIGTAFALSVLGNNLIVGYLGEANLAGGAFLAVGAYASTIALARGMPLVVAAAVGVAAGALIGVLLSIPAARVHGHQLALATLGLAWAAPDVIRYAGKWTGGSNGLYVPVSGGVTPGTGGLGDAYAVSGIFAVCALLVLAVLRGRFGRLLLTHAEAGPAARGFGVRTWAVAMAAWGGCGALGGLSGGLYAHVVGYLSPDEFTFQVSLFIFVGSLVGGARSVPGAWIGGLLAGAVPQLLSDVPGGGSVLTFGVVLAAVVALARIGLYPSLELLPARLRRRPAGGKGDDR